MDRLACVDVVALPLQLLLGEHPDWIDQPAAVIEDERPQSRVLFVNRHARRLGVRTGQRYAMALSLARRADGETTITPFEIDWASYNDPERNAFFRTAPEITHRVE